MVWKIIPKKNTGRQWTKRKRRCVSRFARDVPGDNSDYISRVKEGAVAWLEVVLTVQFRYQQA